MRLRFLGLALCAILAATGCTRLSYTGGARPVAAGVTASDGWLHAAPTPVVRQEAESDCGLAALAMVAGRWNLPVTVDELAKQAPPSKGGVKLGVLRDVARDHGLSAFAIAGGEADLVRELGQGRPVVLGLLLPFQRDRYRSHYEVAIAVNERTGSVVSLDPATGKQMERTRADLEREWKPAGYATLVVTGPKP